MKETTRLQKQTDLELLRDLRTEARKQAWILRKDGYIVDFFNRYRNIGWGKMEQSEIYTWERIIIYECHNGKWDVIADDMSYETFSRFFSVVQRYKIHYGKKNLHNHTNIMLSQLKYQYQ